MVDLDSGPAGDGRLDLGDLVPGDATTHWEWLDLLAELDPSIDVRRDEHFVDDGDLVTSAAGVSAGSTWH